MLIFLGLLVVVAVIIWMTAKLEVHPFLALLFGVIAMGFLAGLDGVSLTGAIADGFGSTLQSIGIVIAAGAIIGEYLDRSGGARVLANKILEKVGEKNAPLSMSLTGYIVSIPVFCDSGFIVLSALNKAISKRTSISLAVLAVALASGLYATHVFVPPTPGPLAAAATLGADVGWVLILGLIVSLPVMMAALLWAALYCKRYQIDFEYEHTELGKGVSPPSFTIAVIPILIPILLIALKSIAEYPT
jgi:GntP family gluconate:H+ symporter